MCVRNPDHLPLLGRRYYHNRQGYLGHAVYKTEALHSISISQENVRKAHGRVGLFNMKRSRRWVGEEDELVKKVDW